MMTKPEENRGKYIRTPIDGILIPEKYCDSMLMYMELRKKNGIVKSHSLKSELAKNHP